MDKHERPKWGEWSVWAWYDEYGSYCRVRQDHKGNVDYDYGGDFPRSADDAYQLGEPVYEDFRRFIVIGTDQGHSTCLPILTYEGRGCAKTGVKPHKHGIIHDERKKPRTVKGEPNLPIWFIGEIVPEDWRIAKKAYEKCWEKMNHGHRHHRQHKNIQSLLGQMGQSTSRDTRKTKGKPRMESAANANDSQAVPDVTPSRFTSEDWDIDAQKHTAAMKSGSSSQQSSWIPKGSRLQGPPQFPYVQLPLELHKEKRLHRTLGFFSSQQPLEIPENDTLQMMPLTGAQPLIGAQPQEQGASLQTRISQAKKGLDQLDDEILFDLMLEVDHLEQLSWTCTPPLSVSTDRIPVTLSGYPVVIPVEGQFPLRGPLVPPPDPHPKFIDPGLALSDDLIEEIFDLYDEALGFYLLVCSRLQIIVPDDFDFNHAISHKPREFGGLDISYITQSLTPCARAVGGSSEEQQQNLQQHMREEESVRKAEPVIKRGATRTPVEAVGSGLAFNMTIGSTVHVVANGSKSKNRFEGCLGVMTRHKGMRYLTIPTHLITAALHDAKCPASTFEGNSWIQKAAIFSSNGNKALGPIVETFDPNPGHFPTGFSHDVSLVDVSEAPENLVGGIKAPISIDWLSQSDWKGIKYQTTKLCLLDEASLSPEKESAKSIGVLDSECQAVGQGVFRMQPPRKNSPFSFLRRAKEKEEGPEAWAGLVAQSLLFRVNRRNGLRSGSVVCVLDEIDDGRKCAKVAGFTAFAQETTAVQKFEIDGPKLYSRLVEGRVAFYGAFQVPSKLRDEHVIF